MTACEFVGRACRVQGFSAEVWTWRCYIGSYGWLGIFQTVQTLEVAAPGCPEPGVPAE